MEQAHAGDGSCARELEQQLRELRCRTQQQEQCIEQYKMETQKMMALSQGAASADSAQGMMKVWLRDARQQSDDLRRLFDESKVIAAETLAATKRELGSKIGRLQQQVVTLEADVAEATKARAGAEEVAERLRHELTTAKRENEVLRCEAAATSSELCGKLTVRQNVTKGEICKLSAEVFTLQQNLMEQAQKSAEAEKRGAESYQQDLVVLNSLLERSSEMRERDRAAFAAALEVAHSDLRDKEKALQETQGRLENVSTQLTASRQECTELSQHMASIQELVNSQAGESDARLVRAVRMKTNAALLHTVLFEWRMVARPGHHISSRLEAVHGKRAIGRLFMQWRCNVIEQHRAARKVRTLQQRRNSLRQMLCYSRWRHYSKVKYQLILTSHRISARLLRCTRLSAFHDWRIKAHTSGMLRRNQMRAATHSDRICMKRVLRVMKLVLADGKWRLFQQQRLISQVTRRERSAALFAWIGQVVHLQTCATTFSSKKQTSWSQRTLSSAFNAWCATCLHPSSCNDLPVRIAASRLRRRIMWLVLSAWQIQTRIRKQSRQRSIRARMHLAQARKERATGRLRNYLYFRRSLVLRLRRVAAKSARSLALQTLRRWSEMRMSWKILSVQSSRCTAKSQCTSLTQALKQWQEKAMHVRVQHVAKRRAEAKYVLKRTIRAFAGFADHRLEARALRKRASSIAQKCTTNFSMSCFRKWINFAFASRHRSKQDYAVDARRRMINFVSLRHCSHRWQECSNHKKALARLGRVVASKRARAQASEIVQFWSAMQQAHKRRKAIGTLVQTRKNTYLMALVFEAWSRFVLLSSVETSYQQVVARLSEELNVVKGDLDIALSKEADSQEELNTLRKVQIPALESENRGLSEKFQLLQMELDAKQAEALSTKTQVSMLQDSINEMRGFLNDPDLHSNTVASDGVMVATIQKELEAERSSAARLKSELQYKDSEILQLSSQITQMEHQIARSQKSIEGLESQMSTDIQSVLHEKALAEQMFSELQKKLTEQFRSESDAKEAEIAALKAHVSVLRTAVEELRRDLDDSFSAPVFPKITASWPAKGNVEAPPISERTSCAVKHEDSSSSSREKYHVDQIQKGAQTSCSAHQGSIQPCGLNQEASADPLEIQDAERGARQCQLASVDENVQKQPGNCDSVPGMNAQTAHGTTCMYKAKISEVDNISWQVLSSCLSPQGSAELSSAPTKRDDISASVICDVSEVRSSSLTLQSPSIDMEGDGYSMSQQSPNDCSPVVEISVALAPTPTVGVLQPGNQGKAGIQGSNLFKPERTEKPKAAAEQGSLVLADKENMGLQSSLDLAESVDEDDRESSMDGSHVASVTVAGRTTRTLATDMTVVIDNSRRAFSAEPVQLRTTTTSFSRRALAPMSSSLSTLSRHSRARKGLQEQEQATAAESSIAEVARIKPQAPLNPRRTLSSSASDPPKPSRATVAKPSQASSRRKRDFSLDSDSD